VEKLTSLQIGFGILAGVPDTDTVYPLLGRPHDSLDKNGDGYVKQVAPSRCN